MNDKLRISDQAYAEHYHAVTITDQILSDYKFDHPTELLTIGEKEYRTIFVNQETGVAIFINTYVRAPENTSIYMCKALECEALREQPMDLLPGRKLRFRELGTGSRGEWDGRKESVLLGLQKLGVVPEQLPTRKILDAVSLTPEGERLLDYGKLKRTVPPIEENRMNYAAFNKPRGGI